MSKLKIKTWERASNMLKLETNIEGKHAQFGVIRDQIKESGFTLGSYWDYDKGFFDNILSKDDAESIYLRMPFKVIDGQLDSYNAHISFETPYVIKHIVHLGLEHDGSSLADATGLSQFQTPIDKDGPIEDQVRWIRAGEEVVVNKVLPYLN